MPVFIFFYQAQNELTQNKGNLKPRYEHTQVDPTYHRVSVAQWQSIRARSLLTVCVGSNFWHPYIVMLFINFI